MNRVMTLRPGSNVCILCRRRLVHLQRRALTSIQKPEIYDVVAVGGGPVGLSLLTAIKSSPVSKHLKTALIETQDLSRSRTWTLPSDQYSNRASSLTPSAVDFIEHVGAWKHVDHSRVRPYDEMQVYDAANDASIQFDWKGEAERYNAPPRNVATMVENANLVKALLGRISELEADESLLTSSSVQSISHGEDDPEGFNLSSWPVVTIKNSNTDKTTRIAARLLIGADGLNSPVRTFAGISTHGWDYNRHGVVATLATEFDNTLPSTAYQRFLPSFGGPIALLPLPTPHHSLVWSTHPKHAAYLKSLNPTSFLALLNAAFRLREPDLAYMLSLPATQPGDPDSNAHESELLSRLPHTPSPLPADKMPPIITSLQPDTLASFPLRFRHASSLVGPRVALAGDAAHTIHPLAGQGLNLGLADARALAVTIEDAVSHGRDLGDLASTLEGYGAARFGRGLMMAGVVDGLEKVYALGGTGDGVKGLLGEVLGRARGVGMGVVGSRWAQRAREGIMGFVE